MTGRRYDKPFWTPIDPWDDDAEAEAIKDDLRAYGWWDDSDVPWNPMEAFCRQERLGTGLPLVPHIDSYLRAEPMWFSNLVVTDSPKKIRENEKHRQARERREREEKRRQLRKEQERELRKKRQERFLFRKQLLAKRPAWDVLGKIGVEFPEPFGPDVRLWDCRLGCIQFGKVPLSAIWEHRVFLAAVRQYFKISPWHSVICWNYQPGIRWVLKVIDWHWLREYHHPDDYGSAVVMTIVGNYCNHPGAERLELHKLDREERE